jgi:hypothetical protein
VCRFVTTLERPGSASAAVHVFSPTANSVQSITLFIDTEVDRRGLNTQWSCPALLVCLLNTEFTVGQYLINKNMILSPLAWVVPVVVICTDGGLMRARTAHVIVKRINSMAVMFRVSMNLS